MPFPRRSISSLALSGLALFIVPSAGRCAPRQPERTVLAAEGVDYTPVGSANAVEAFKVRKKAKPVHKPAS